MHQALAFIELPVDNVDSQCSNVSHAVHHFVSSLLWQKFCGSRKQSKSLTCERLKLSVMHSRVFVQYTKLLQSRLKSAVCVCANCQHSSLHCFGSSVDLQNLVRIKGVP
jgi:hypothetical protein